MVQWIKRLNIWNFPFSSALFEFFVRFFHIKTRKKGLKIACRSMSFIFACVDCVNIYCGKYYIIVHKNGIIYLLCYRCVLYERQQNRMEYLLTDEQQVIVKLWLVSRCTGFIIKPEIFFLTQSHKNRCLIAKQCSPMFDSKWILKTTKMNK